MKLPLTRLANIAMTIILNDPPNSISFITSTSGRLHSEFVLLVRLGGYIVNLCTFYSESYSLIGKLTAFLQLFIASTSGRLHSEFVCLLFLQTHRSFSSTFCLSGTCRVFFLASSNFLLIFLLIIVLG
jgi:hypothetical protein